jgi:Flp pilus assembly protein TadG
MERKINRRGSIAVESIFSLIIIFMLLSASIDYGVYYHRQATLVKSCSTAAEHLSLYPNEHEVVARVATDSYFANTGQYAEFKIDISGGYVTVDAESEYTPMFGFTPAPDTHKHKATVLIREL